MQYLRPKRKVDMKNKVFTVTVYNGKTVRIIFSEKLHCYFIELNDMKKLFDVEIKDLPEKYRGNLNYFDVKFGANVKKLAGVAEEDIEVIKNFSKLKDAEYYAKSILTIISDMKTSYCGYTKGMILPQEEQDELISSFERKTRKINVLEGQLEELKEGAKLYFEFTDNTSMVPLRRVHEKLKYKTTYTQLLGHLRQSGAIDEFCRPTASLVENGCFRYFTWISQIGDKEKKTTQIVVSDKGIRYINEILEKANGKTKRS